MSTVVVALGGNAILRAGQQGTYAEQKANISEAAQAIVELIRAGHKVVVTHGNGPQVGAVLIQQEEASQVVPAMPLDACGAYTQGLLGWMFQEQLRNALISAGLSASVATVVTQTEVDGGDPAFANPSKPVGPYYPAEKAQELMATKGWAMKEDQARGGWRRLVASPEPLAIIESEAIAALVNAGTLVIAGGGGGVPVVKQADGTSKGVEAVIDKDLAGYRLAVDVKADAYLILTDVEYVAINFGKPDQQWLHALTAAELRALQAEGHFAAGSMGPKVEACLRFAEAGGRAIIGSPAKAVAALKGESGTQITL